MQKQAQIDKYFDKEKTKLLKQWEKTPKEIMNSYFGIKAQKEEKLAQDKKLLLQAFLNGKYNIKDYAQDKIDSNYSKILSQAMISELENNREQIEKNIFEFLNSLYEYKNYLNFKFLVDDIKKYYQEKDKYKKSYEDTKRKEYGTQRQ